MDTATQVDLLQTMAEIAAAFAGFAALVSLFRGGAVEKGRVFGIANAVVISLSSIGASMLAAILLSHVSASLTWSLCSALVAVGWVGGTWRGIAGYREATESDFRQDNPGLFVSAISLSVLGVGLLAINLIYPDGENAGLRYLLALLAQLAIAAQMFFVAVFTPDTELETELDTRDP